MILIVVMNGETLILAKHGLRIEIDISDISEKDYIIRAKKIVAL